jgi:hypothetical protein
MNSNSTLSNFQNLKLVFVHLGKAKANHLWHNLNSVQVRFPDLEIVLISDRFHKELLKLPKVHFFEYKRNEDAVQRLQLLKHDLKFRSGFWRYTIERFMALSEYHQANPDFPILHIESDILLLPGFPFDKVLNLEKLAWLRADTHRDVAALFFTPGWQQTNWLMSEILEEIAHDPFATDMSALNKIRKDHREKITIFPSYSHKVQCGITWEGQINNELTEELSLNSEYFEGIFDPAAFGMWLTGSDPRNYYGKQIIFDTEEIINGGSYVDPSIFKYEFGNGGSLTAKFSESEVKIWSLHVHSKDQKLLGIAWEERLQNLVIRSRQGRIYSEFKPRILFDLVQSNFRDRTFISWILHIPMIRPFFSFLRKFRSILGNKP